MENFVTTMMWLNIFGFAARVACMATGAWSKPRTLSVYAADTVLEAALAIWAGFALFY